MKLNKTTILAAVLFAATLFAGCKFAGTTANYKNDEETDYLTTYDSVKLPGTVIQGEFDANVDKSQKFTFYIVSNGAIDSKNITESITFSSAKTNTADSSYYPELTALGAPTLVEVDFRKKNAGSRYLPNNKWYAYVDANGTIYEDEEVFVTKCVYAVDTSAMETDTVALFVDATKLKEKSGKLILNNDDNEKCGEDTDSLIFYYEGIAKAGGTLTSVNVPGIVDQHCAPTIAFNVYDVVFDKAADETKQRVLVKVNAPAGSDATDADTFNAQLAKMYSIQTLAVDATSWTDGALEFTYVAAPTPHYEGKSGLIDLGTQYYIVRKNDSSFTWAAKAAKYGNRAPKITYGKDRKEFVWNGTCYYHDTEPAYIVTDSAFTAGEYDYSDVQNVQKDILGVDPLSDGIIKVSLKPGILSTDIRLGETKGFKVTSMKAGKAGAELEIESVTPVSDDKGVTAVYLQLKNRNYNITASSVTVWVGAETTITGNTINNQTKFGYIALKQDNTVFDALPGYIALAFN